MYLRIDDMQIWPGISKVALTKDFGSNFFLWYYIGMLKFGAKIMNKLDQILTQNSNFMYHRKKYAIQNEKKVNKHWL